MKKLLILPLMALLSGCVTYYYPETALEDGVYYAEDDPAYTVYSDGYVGVGYYPWYSLDYFYLGYYSYPRYRVTYGYPGGFYLGFSYGFSPWYYPSHHYGYYSPWYASYHHYPYYPAWRPYHDYYAHHHGDRYWKKKHHDRGHDRYGRGDRHDRYAGRGGRDDHYDRGREDPAQMGSSRDQGSNVDSTSVRRYVSTAPGGRNGERGVVVRSREATKVGKSELHVGRQAPVSKSKAGSAGSKTIQPTYQVRSTGGEVRYRSNSKPSRSRTEPVTSKNPSKGVAARPAVTSSPSIAVSGAKRSSGSAPTRSQSSVRATRASPKSSPSRAPKASGSSRAPSKASHSSSSGRSSKTSSSQRNNRK